MFYAKRRQNYQRFGTDDMVFADITPTHKYIENARTNRLRRKYKYILTSPVMCTHQLMHTLKMNNLLIQKFILQRFTTSFLLKNYSLLKFIYLLIIFNNIKSFMWNTKNTDRNGLNEQNTHTTYREKHNFRKG